MKLQENMIFDSHYTLQRQLGRGGFSEVWLAHDSYMDLDVAIKIYAPGQGMDEHSINEFRHEIKEVFHLNHSNLLKPQHLGIWENMPYLIMAYCPAGSCEKRVGAMTEPELWKLIRDVASGLTYLHEKDVIHQDIKPDNILIDTEGNYLITDFGISTRARSTLQKSVVGSSISQGSGTVAYMGPERFSQQPAPTKASDIWSLGATLFELIEGTTPFPREVGGGMQKMGAEIPSINAPISDALKFTIFKMLSKETWDRPTAATLVEWATKPDAIQVDYSVFTKKATTNISSSKEPLVQQKSNSGSIIAIIFLILATIIMSALYVDAIKRRDYWYRESEKYDQQLGKVKKDLDIVKRQLSEKESLLSSIANNIPLIITDLKIGNAYDNGNIETNYGSTIYSRNTMYIKPRINYVGLKSGTKTFKVKIFRPSGTLSTGSSSPSGYSFSDTSYISIGQNTLTLSGWGNKTKGHWSAGVYRIEIWCDNKCLSSKSFTIY
jgi:serine/threonine protein kinase